MNIQGYDSPCFNSTEILTMPLGHSGEKKQTKNPPISIKLQLLKKEEKWKWKESENKGRRLLLFVQQCSLHMIQAPLSMTSGLNVMVSKAK